jgi:hypothetical protein
MFLKVVHRRGVPGEGACFTRVDSGGRFFPGDCVLGFSVCCFYVNSCL